MEFSSPFPKLPKQFRNRILGRILFKSVIYSFAIFGIFFVLFLFAVLGMIKQKSSFVSSEIPKEATLHIDFNQKYSESTSENLLLELSDENVISFYELINAIKFAKTDDKIKAIKADISKFDLGLAQVQSLRTAILDFRNSGKKAYVYSRGFGTFGGGTSEYYLASAFDEIWQQPTTEVGITGISIEVPFIKKLLDKIGISPEFYTRHEYKNAYASLTSDKMSNAYRSELNKLGGGIFDVIVTDIAQSRSIDVVDVKKAISNAPLSAVQGVEYKLIDKIAYSQDLDKHISFKAVDVNDYVMSIELNKSSDKLALVVLEGVIDSSSPRPLNQSPFIDAKSTIKTLDDISRLKGVKALVIRINSPGGAHSASNEIWNAIVKFKEKAKIPVVMSFGDYAASGGYYIAMAGDYIFAEPLTITGSIGVLGGKFVAEKLMQNLDVNWAEISFGKNAGILSSNRKFTKSEAQVFNKSLDRVYLDFTTKVSEARKISMKDIDKLARGRVWLGRDAVNNKLVDELGGIEQSIKKAINMAKLEDKDIEVVVYPKPKSFSEKIKQAFGGGMKISINQLVSELGLDINSLSVLKDIKYELMAMPVVIRD